MSFAKTYQNTRMPTADPCDRCPNAQSCDQICISRARWWDRGIEKIKEALKREEEIQNAGPPRVVESGKTYWARPYFPDLLIGSGGTPVYHYNDGNLRPGVCVYVHPEGRFATLLFRVDYGTIRESFKLEELYEKR